MVPTYASKNVSQVPADVQAEPGPFPNMLLQIWNIARASDRPSRQPLPRFRDSDITAVVATEALRVEALEKFFPPAASGWRGFLHPLAKATVPALRGISFSVQPGEVLALVGANGAGKSTLLRILTTLLLPTRGRAWVGGADVENEPQRVLRQLGFHSGSDASFYARLSARENLSLFAALNNIPSHDAATRIAHL